MNVSTTAPPHPEWPEEGSGCHDKPGEGGAWRGRGADVCVSSTGTSISHCFLPTLSPAYPAPNRPPCNQLPGSALTLPLTPSHGSHPQISSMKQGSTRKEPSLWSPADLDQDPSPATSWLGTLANVLNLLASASSSMKWHVTCWAVTKTRPHDEHTGFLHKAEYVASAHWKGRVPLFIPFSISLSSGKRER